MIVLNCGPLLQVVVQPTVLVSCRHCLHYHHLLAPLPPSLQSQLPSQSFVILCCSPVAGSEAAAQANCQEDEDRGEDDVAGGADKTGTDQSAVDVLDAGILPLVWTNIQRGQDSQVDPEETLSQHRVCRGLDVEITCSVLSYHHSVSLPSHIYPHNSGCAHPRSSPGSWSC